MEKTKKKKRIKLGGVLVLILFGYLLFSFAYYVFKLPIKHIEIKNNYYVTDDYIIKKLNLKNKTLFELSSKDAEKKLNTENLITDAHITKNIFGKVIIDIKEEKILFYDWNTKKIVTFHEEIDYDKKYLGVPSLINYVPSDIYGQLIKKLNNVDRNIIAMISEIEYSPDKLNDVVLDDTRFLLRMNDGIKIYVNVYNIKKLNNYLEIYDAILKNGSSPNACLYLDSNSKNYIYGSCDKASVLEVEGSEEDEKKLR